MNHPELSKGQSSVEILDIIEETRVNGNLHQSGWSKFIPTVKSLKYDLLLSTLDATNF